jgi:hypothetical protein
VGSDPVDWRQVRRAYISACLAKFHADVELVQIRVLHCGLSQRQLTATTSRGAPAIFIPVLKAAEYFFGEKLNCLIDVTVTQKKVCITLDAPAREEFTESASIKRGGSSQTNH